MLLTAHNLFCIVAYMAGRVAISACKWKLPQPTRITIKDHRYYKCQVTCCHFWSFKSNIPEKYYLYFAAQNQLPLPTASAARGQFFNFVVVIITASYLTFSFFSAYLREPQKSYSLLFQLLAQKRSKILKLAFLLHTKLTVSWASLSICHFTSHTPLDHCKQSSAFSVLPPDPQKHER